jgi:pyruvate kinase
MTETDLVARADERRDLLDELLALRQELMEGAAARLRVLSWADAEGRYPASAHNLAHYLAMRCRDLRPLQLRLARQGLSSLGRVEAHVLASIDQVIHVLAGLGGAADPPLDPSRAPGFDAGNDLLSRNTRGLFGPPQPGRAARIMVTMPSEAASDEDLVRALLESGMDAARINCAHDDVIAWRRMIEHVRRAEQSVGRSCRVLMDLAGHKIRTGPLEETPSWIRLRPRKAEGGATAAPAQLILRPYSAQVAAMPVSEADACLMLDSRGTQLIQAGDRLEFTDLRGKRRVLEVDRALEDGGWLVHCHKNARMGPETDLRVLRTRAGHWLPVDAQPIRLSGYRTRPVKIRLVEGDALRLTSPERPGRAARRDASGQVVEPARIGITAAAVLERLRPGQPVWIDDGKAGAVVEEIDRGSALLRVTQAPPGGFRLRADKGINLPGAALELGPLSDKDMQDLDFVARNADLVGFSFVETASDMLVLMDELQRRGAGSMGIVAKIETERALRNLPEIMLSTIGRHPLAVMIARGDLAVEIGGERLAEVQEEILWLAEAGHVPVIWATQVLETLAKTGAISRPELSDAAMSGRAECVMLNKGPFIMSAVRTLDAILRRMQGHQLKKMPQLRALQLAHQG